MLFLAGGDSLVLDRFGVGILGLARKRGFALLGGGWLRGDASQISAS